jgi:hypothetical protein
LLSKYNQINLTMLSKIGCYLLLLSTISYITLSKKPLPGSVKALQRVIITYRSGMKNRVKSLAQTESNEDHYNPEFHHEFDFDNSLVVTMTRSSVARLQRNPEVVRVETDVIRKQLAQTIPYGIESVQAPDTWAEGATGLDKLICVIDSGIDVSHEDFANVNIVGGYPEDFSTDTCGHGTHVAGTIAASNNDIGVIGVATNVSLYIVKVFNGPYCSWVYSSTLINAIEKCRDANADIVSMSLGGSAYSNFEERRLNRMYSNRNMLFFAAAGNRYSTSHFYPASYESVISIAAVDKSNNWAFFSQRNSQVELCAPGVDVLSTLPGNMYAEWSGTSMATPHASAAAALIWSSFPHKTNIQIRNAMKATSKDLGSVGRDDFYGFGLIQAHDAWLYLNNNGENTNVLPVAVFQTFTNGLFVKVDAIGSYDYDGTIVSYMWNFGDGNANVRTRNTEYTYEFSEAGEYTIQLYVIDSNRARSEFVSHNVVVGGEYIELNITSVEISQRDSGAFDVFWTTNIESDSQVEFTCCGIYSDPDLVLDHWMSFIAARGTTLVFSIISTTEFGNTATSGPYTHTIPLI